MIESFSLLQGICSPRSSGAVSAVISRYRNAVEVLRNHPEHFQCKSAASGTEVSDVFNGIPAMAFPIRRYSTHLRRVVARPRWYE